MKEKLKYITIILLILITILLLPKITLATGTPELNIETAKTNLELGEEFTVSVKFNDNGSTECLGFDFGLKYDKTILEVVNSSITLDKGATVINDKVPGSVNFVLISITPVQYTGELFTVTFRVKQDANGGETAFEISSDNSESPIENENGIVETKTQTTSITIAAPIKEKNNTGFQLTSENKNTEDNEQNIVEENIKNSNITELNKDNTTTETEDTIEDKEIIKNEESTSNSEKKEQIGLPTKAVAIILAISVIGLISIFLMLKKKKK